MKDWKNEEEVSDYLQKILDKQAFDRTGLIYGMGHAVYTLSDPREVILKKYNQIMRCAVPVFPDSCKRKGFGGCGQ